MLNLDPAKLLVIGVVTLIVLGPDKLPLYTRQIGNTWRSFSEFRQRMESEVREAVPGLPSTSEIASYARSPGALLDRLSAESPSDEESPPRANVEGDPPAPVRPEAEEGSRHSDAVDSEDEAVWPERQTRLVGDATWN
jgi:Sec-independent protein translocase protein TatA